VGLSIEATSTLEVLSLNDCDLQDSLFTTLEKTCKGRLLNIREVDLTANKNLTTACLDCLTKMTSG